MMVAVLWVEDALDDRVLVEVFLDQLSDVPLGPGCKAGIFFRPKVDNEVAEEASAIEGFAEGRGDFPSIVSTVAGAERVDAMAILLVSPAKKAFTLDAKRRVIEAYAEQDYDSTEYYEKWIRAIRNLLVEAEVVTREEVEARIAEVRKAMRAKGRKVANAGVPWD